MNYTLTNWEDYPSRNTPVDSTRLNKMDRGIKACSDAINDLEENVDDQVDNLATEINKLQTALAAARAELESLNAEIEATKGELETAKGELQVINDALSFSEDGISTDRFITAITHGCGFVSQHDETGNSIRFGVGTGGVNRGIWDDVRNNWMLSRESATSDDLTIPGNIKNGTYSLNGIGSNLGSLVVGQTPPNLPSGVSYYRALLWSGSSDKYWILMSSAGKLFTGCQMNGSSTVTWAEK